MTPARMPTFEQSRAQACELLRRAAAQLRSDWYAGSVTPAQSEGRRVALEAIARATVALDGPTSAVSHRRSSSPLVVADPLSARPSPHKKVKRALT